jgi:hypothetical protein
MFENKMPLLDLNLVNDFFLIEFFPLILYISFKADIFFILFKKGRFTSSHRKRVLGNHHSTLVAVT